MIVVKQGDCIEWMTKLKAGSIDLILTDPPYGTTACKWDVVIQFEPMWKQVWRVLKPNGACVLFGSEPFSSALRMSQIKFFKYDWIWDKGHGANFAQANRRPLNTTEIISVWYKTQANYYPQKIKNPKGVEARRRYNESKQKEVFEGQCSMTNSYVAAGRNYEPELLLPKNILRFKREYRPVHPTQKPVLLLEYLIKTYTKEGEVVLDFTMGSGSAGVACVNTNRSFIGIERDEKYFEIAKQRIIDTNIISHT